MRCSGIRLSRSSRTAGSDKVSRIMSVSIGPGCTELQRMLSLACCIAVALVKSRTAPLVAVYAEEPYGFPTRPAVEEMLTMEPPPARRMAGMARSEEHTSELQS